MKAGYKMTELGELPEEWELVNLVKVASIKNSNVDKKSDKSEITIRLCNYMDVYNNDYISDKLNFMTATAKEEEINKFLLYQGDVIITKDSETKEDIAKATVVTENFKDVLCGYHLSLIRPSSDLEGVYLSKLFGLNIVKQQLVRKANGTTRFGLNISVIQDLLIPLPPLPEQEKIARILSTVDRKIEAIGAQIEQARVLKKGLLQRLLTRGIGHTRFKETALGEVPEAWEVVELSSLAKCFVGIASSATHAYTDHGVLLIRNQNIKSGKIVLDDILMVDKEYDIQHKSKRLRAGDILTVRTGYPGISAVVPPELENCQSFTTLIVRRFKEIISSDFLCYYINSDLGKSFFASGQAGGAQKNIGAKVLQKMKIIIPPLPEQEKIAQILSTADEKIDMLQAKQAAYRELKKGLMQQLLTGKIRVSPSP